MSMITGTSTRRFAAAIGITAALVTGALAPTAHADPGETTGEQNCIVLSELAEVLCAPVGEDLNEKVLEETGLTVIESTTAPSAARATATPSAARAVYVLARLYDDADYGGSSLAITDASACNGTVGGTADIGSSWYGRVSSFAVYNGCSVKIYASTSFGGSSYGYAGNTSYVGSTMNDKTRSVRTK